MSFTAITGCDKTVGVTADVGMTINRDNVELTTAGAGYRLNTVNSRHTPAARGASTVSPHQHHAHFGSP